MLLALVCDLELENPTAHECRSLVYFSRHSSGPWLISWNPGIQLVTEEL